MATKLQCELRLYAALRRRRFLVRKLARLDLLLAQLGQRDQRPPDHKLLVTKC